MKDPFSRRSPARPPRRLLMGLLTVAVAITPLILGGGHVLAQRGDVEVEFRNQSTRSVKVLRWNEALGSWENWGAVNSGSVASEPATYGSRWALVNPANNVVLDQLVVNRFTRVLEVTDRHFATAQPDGEGDHGHGPGSGHPPRPVMIEVRAHNHSSQTLYLYRDGGRGAYEYVATLNAGQERVVTTPVDTEWVFVLPSDQRVVGRLKAGSGQAALDVHDEDIAPPRPQPTAVGVTFVNLSGESVIIAQKGRGDGPGRPLGTIRNRYQQRVQAMPGDTYQLIRRNDNRVVRTYSIPGQDTTITIRHADVFGPEAGGPGIVHDHGHGHDDHGGHAGNHEGGGPDDHEDHVGPGPGPGPGSGGNPAVTIDPREVFRRLFGR